MPAPKIPLDDLTALLQQPGATLRRPDFGWQYLLEVPGREPVNVNACRIKQLRAAGLIGAYDKRTRSLTIYLAANAPPRTVEGRLAAHGFALTPMGGNCTAYLRCSADGVEEVLTSDEHEYTAPEFLRERCELTTSDRGGINVDTVSGFTLAEALAALEHPGEEYALLWLRISNNLHKETR